MYPKKHIINIGVVDRPSVNPFCPDARICRPLSFYFRGGVDVSGRDPRKPLPSAPDDPDHPGEVNILTDSTVDRLELLDMATSLDHEADLRAVETATGDHIVESE